ncbi:MAG: hypothetical protein PHI27_01135 [Eubacteriales bacterium]|nr:hypothetical protein [Eubacteriales bacterium]MDD3880838.1 hypothetical protein [Eubacteriales bacterium]MDD4511795.1 hypothetical protein [Eubacteriales bacterium]
MSDSRAHRFFSIRQNRRAGAIDKRKAAANSHIAEVIVLKLYGKPLYIGKRRAEMTIGAAQSGNRRGAAL